MTKKFTIIGNCQSKAILDFLLSNDNFSGQYNYINVDDIYRINEDDINNLYNNILPILDLIIIQPISDNYKNNYKYSTKSILSTVKKECIKILFPSLYFDMYHPFMCYVYDKDKPSWKLDKPFDYHDKNIIKQFIENKNITDINFFVNEYLKIQNDENILSNETLDESLKKNINNLTERESKYKNYCTEDTYIIMSSDFILNNYMKELLFYSINHPTKYLFRYISDRIFIILNIFLIKYKDDIDPLKSLIMPLYKCIQKKVNFNVNNYFHFQHFENKIDNYDIINKYHDSYKNININLLYLSF